MGLLKKAHVKPIALTSSNDTKFAEVLSRLMLVDYITIDTPNAFGYAAGLVGRLFKNKFYKVLIVEDSLTAAIILEEMLNLLNF